MERRAFLSLLGTATVASASPAILPMEELSYLTCVAFRNDYLSQKKEIILTSKELKPISNLSHKLEMTRKTVGFGRFNLLSIDEMLYVGRNYSKVGEFTRAEMELLESLFYEKASQYDFTATRY